MERDAGLVELVSAVLPPPAGVEVVIGDARAETERAGPGRYDVIVADVYDRAAMPASVAGDAVLVAGDALGGWVRRAAVAHGPGLAQFATGAKARLDEPG